MTIKKKDINAMTESRFAKFQKEQLKIMRNCCRTGISEEGKKKLQEKLEDIYFEMKKPSIAKRLPYASSTNSTL